MPRFVAFVVFSLAALVCAGCGDRYKDVADKQVANWKEIAGILRNVKDQDSMNEAEDKLLAKLDRFQEVSRQAKSLPPPDETTSLRLQAEVTANGMTAALAAPDGGDFKLPAAAGDAYFAGDEAKMLADIIISY